ncbi:MAG: hypothetical protein GY859_14140 [Desulfobacterales bacterium]|nr:hypothetical protein [Desulfobacterales bacterium]
MWRDAVKSTPPRRRKPIWILLTLFLIWGCDERDALVGKYASAPANSPGAVSATLELQADGKGFWSIETDNAPFRWDVTGGKIRLHTQSGGVIECVLDHNAIKAALPGVGVIVFERVP